MRNDNKHYRMITVELRLWKIDKQLNKKWLQDLGVMLDEERTFTSHIHHLYHNHTTTVPAQLCQLHTVSCSLQTPPLCSFLTAQPMQPDYCYSLYVSLPAGRFGCLDWVLWSATCLPGCIPKFGYGAVHKVRLARGGRRGSEKVTVCDRGVVKSMWPHFWNFYHTYETWNWQWRLTFCCDGCILT